MCFLLCKHLFTELVEGCITGDGGLYIYIYIYVQVEAALRDCTSNGQWTAGSFSGGGLQHHVSVMCLSPGESLTIQRR